MKLDTQHTISQDSKAEGVTTRSATTDPRGLRRRVGSREVRSQNPSDEARPGPAQVAFPGSGFILLSQLLLSGDDWITVRELLAKLRATNAAGSYTQALELATRAALVRAAELERRDWPHRDPQLTKIKAQLITAGRRLIKRRDAVIKITPVFTMDGKIL